jgi:hypothetical protein
LYFPTLSAMKAFQIDEFVIQKLDVWLGTRRKAVWKFLNPIQFSLDSDIDEETAIHLFAVCTDQRIHVLQQRYSVECPCCNRELGLFELPAQIPQTIYCVACDEDVKVTEDYITIWFKLIEKPAEQPYKQLAAASIRRGEALGKDYSLRPERLQRSSSDMARRLVTGINERFRSTT